MNNLSQPSQSAEPDMALLFLGSLFETLHGARHRDDAMLDGLARHIILDEHPKTLLGLAIAARAEKWLRRRLWMEPFDSLPPSKQGIRVVIDGAMRIDDYRARAQ
jgi:hypothetical protein